MGVNVNSSVHESSPTSTSAPPEFVRRRLNYQVLGDTPAVECARQHGNTEVQGAGDHERLVTHVRGRKVRGALREHDSQRWGGCQGYRDPLGHTLRDQDAAPHAGERSAEGLQPSSSR